MTDKAIEGLKMNLASWGALITFLAKKNMENRIVWRSIGTMALENFFSKVRAVNPNPTFYQFKNIFRKATEQFSVYRLTPEARGWSTGTSRDSSRKQIYGTEICDPGEEDVYQFTRKPKSPAKTPEAKEEKMELEAQVRATLTEIKNSRARDLGNFRSAVKKGDVSVDAGIKVDKKK